MLIVLIWDSADSFPYTSCRNHCKNTKFGRRIEIKIPALDAFRVNPFQSQPKNHLPSEEIYISQFRSYLAGFNQPLDLRRNFLLYDSGYGKERINIFGNINIIEDIQNNEKVCSEEKTMIIRDKVVWFHFDGFEGKLTYSQKVRLQLESIRANKDILCCVNVSRKRVLKMGQNHRILYFWQQQAWWFCRRDSLNFTSRLLQDKSANLIDSSSGGISNADS